MSTGAVAPPGGFQPGVREAFEAWWQANGYQPPDDTDDRDVWDRYHMRYGLAWMGFAAGWRAGRGQGA